MALIVLDAGVVIAVLSAGDAHHEAARRTLGSALQAGDEFTLPASAYAEILVEPYEHDKESVQAVDAFLDALPAPVAPIDQEIAKVAAQLRARHRSLRLPDAMVIATAEALAADRVMTTDRRWPRRLTITVQLVGRQATRRPRGS